jgi:tRNA(Ile)-lysidine synthase
VSPAELLEQVARAGLLTAGAPVLVLFSGGRDSTALLDVALRIAGPEAVSALHVNYGLREAAQDDERHSAALCARLGVGLEIRHSRQPPAGNLQAWAREVRYRAAAEIARVRGAEVAAGHTATDQVETVLYRLASSPSRRALLGMRPKEGALIRPLLPFTREQTADYCRQRGLGWREDQSNTSSLYARGRVRERLVPALRAIHPAAEQNVLTLIEVLRQEADVLGELVDGILAGAAQIELERLRGLPPALRRLVVQRLADGAAGAPAPGAAPRADEIAALRDHAALDLPHGIRAEVRRGTLRLVRRNGEAPCTADSHPGARGSAPIN